MIGHKMNGCTVVAAAPGSLTGTYAILAVINDKVNDPDRPGDPYVTAWVNVEDMPTPDHWSTGNYFTRFTDAVEDFQERVVDEPLSFSRGVSDFLEVHLNKKPEAPTRLTLTLDTEGDEAQLKGREMRDERMRDEGRAEVAAAVEAVLAKAWGAYEEADLADLVVYVDHLRAALPPGAADPETVEHTEGITIRPAGGRS